MGLPSHTSALAALLAFLAPLTALLTSCSGGSSGGVVLLADTDGDGLPDVLEDQLESDASDADDPYNAGALDAFDESGPSGDGIPDGLERHLVNTTNRSPITTRSDADFDGIPDYLEVRAGMDWLDFDDPVFDGNKDLDSAGPPGDGIQDGLEGYLLLRGAARPITASSDSDGDRIKDVVEVRAGSNPFDARDPFYGEWIDVDGDGLSDALEVEYSLDPLDGNRPYFNGGMDVIDEGGPPGDGISDALERYVRILGATPPVTARTDSDGDGVPDYLEARTGSDLLDPNDPSSNGAADADGDGASNALELLLTRYGAIAIDLTRDTDGDRITDTVEVATGSNPFDKRDPAFLEQSDGDLDGIPDSLEWRFGTDPDDPDSPVVAGGNDTDDTLGPAGDGISDAFEALAIAQGVAAPVSVFSDADEDGVGDLVELLFFSDPNDPDSPEIAGGEDVASPAGPAGDGVSDALEAVLLNLGLPAPITAGRDLDNDAIPDVIEFLTFTDAFSVESPAPNRSSDVDSDGAPDYLEVLALSNPLSADDPVIDGGSDVDEDGLSAALEECLVRLGVPGNPIDVDRDSDSDGDGLIDLFEVQLPSRFLDPNHPVTGGGDTNEDTGPADDKISDALEHYLIASGALAPVTRVTDSDVDGVFDLYEMRFGTGIFDHRSPFPPGQGFEDPDGDGIIAAIEQTLLRLGASDVGPATDLDLDFAPDYIELRIGMDPEDPGDPSPAGALDTDGDNIPESVELLLQAMGVVPPIDGFSDGDGDGISDVFEISGPQRGSYRGLPVPDPGNADLPWPAGAFDADDGDGGGGPVDLLSDGLERMLVAIGARPPVDHGSDTDGDGAPDWLEVAGVTHPGNVHHPVPNGGEDSDGDSMSDALEFLLLHLGADGPLDLSSDSDGDGIPDYFEVLHRGHPLDGDYPLADGGADQANATGPSGDGISDGLEFLLIQLGTRMPVVTFSESDGDGLPDYIEVRTGSHPHDSDSPLHEGDADTNDTTGPSGDGIPDALELYLILLGATGPITEMTDSDEDRVPDFYEVLYGTDPFDPDSTVMGTPPHGPRSAHRWGALPRRNLDGVLPLLRCRYRNRGGLGVALVSQ